ncbi:MAG: type III-A CRISPR-associated protein Csm2 [Candidatus Cloacimonas sp.]|jgi:CRISPR type III-A-associated protein Csm2|nr:type III-A CRISPR-associated protein Csm2 [Candidatus Cloacimonas sp.]
MMQEIKTRDQVKKDPDPKSVNNLEFFIDGKLNPLWVSDYAEYYSVMVLAEKRMTINQLRAFFNEFLRIQDLAEESNPSWIVMAKMMEAKAVYRVNSSSARIPYEFSVFITKLISDVGNDLSKFKAACVIMEALVAYFKKDK